VSLGKFQVLVLSLPKGSEVVPPFDPSISIRVTLSRSKCDKLKALAVFARVYLFLEQNICSKKSCVY